MAIYSLGEHPKKKIVPNRKDRVLSPKRENLEHIAELICKKRIKSLEGRIAQLEEKLRKYEKYQELIEYLERKNISPERALEIIMDYVLKKEEPELDTEIDIERLLKLW